MFNPVAIEFAEKLVEEASRTSAIRHAFLCCSGAMANENALKVCYQKNAPAGRVLAFAHCFMGRSVTMAQIGDSAKGREGIPLSTQVDYLPFYDHVAARRMGAGDVSGPTRYIDMCLWHLEQYIERYPGQHACFIFELVQGEGGFNTALPDFHRVLMEACRSHGIAVWSDEVQTFGRTERMFCFDALGLGEYVDVVSIGKMSQVCAAMYTEAYNPKPGLLSGTFLGSSAALHVGKRVLERLLEGGYYSETDGHGRVTEPGRIHRHHRIFRDGVASLARRHPDLFAHNHRVHEIASGYGGMMRMTPFAGQKDPVMKLCRACFDEGLIVFYCGHDPYHLRMLPPLGAMEESDWDPVFEILERALVKVAGEMDEIERGSIRPMRRSASEPAGAKASE
jgi:4-aminobutyrate aminotransferase-like enzyme